MSPSNHSTGTRTGSQSLKWSRKSRLLMLAIAPVVAIYAAAPAMAATLTWDPLLNGNGSDGNGSWDLTTAEWAAPGDVVWPNDTSTAVFGSGGTAGVVTITAPNINAGGLTFNSGYTIGANAGSTLTLTGTTNTVSVVSGSAMINAPIAGTTGMIITAASGSSLTLGGVNTYTGNTVVNGSVILSAGSNFGGSPLILGTSNTSTVGNITINANTTVAGISSSTASGTNTITLNNNATLLDTGAFQIGLTANANFAGSNTSLVFNTDASNTTVNVTPANNTNFTIGGRNGSFSGATAGSLNLSNVTNFIYNTGATGTGNFTVGLATRSIGFFTGALNNSITAAVVDIGDSTDTAANENQSGTSVVTLGNGTNVIQTGTLIIGNAKASGTLTFASGATTGNITITGQAGGISTTNITIGTASVATQAGNSTLSLAGHNAIVQASTVTVGNLAGSTAGPAGGILTFDTGTFNVANLIIANNSSGTDAAGPTGNVTIGGTSPTPTATGVFNVTNTFLLTNNTNTATTATANGTFTINGGTVNSFAAITRIGNGTSTLNLNAGKLNMNNNGIGSAALQITNVNLANSGGFSATLQSLGGTGVNGGGLTVSGAGTLILAGTNSYTGGTTVNSTLQVGSPTLAGSLPAGGAVAVNGTLTFAGSGTSSMGTLSGGGTIVQNAGTSLIGDPGSNFGGTATINGGAFGGVGTVASVTVAGGNLQAGTSAADTSGVLTVNSLTVNSGGLAFNLGAGGASSSISSGSVIFSSTPTLSFNLVGSLTSGSTYTLLTDTGGTLPAATFAPVSLGRGVINAVDSGSTITATFTGSGPANLVYTNASGSGRFDVQTSKNFSNAGTPDFFFQLDNVTFNDTNTSSHTVNIASAVTPTSMTVTTTSGYTFTGTGSIGGTTGLTVNGGTVVLGNTGGNTYTGTTAINSGKLQLAAAGVLPTGATVSISGGASLDLNGNNATLGSLSGTGTIVSTNTTTGATLTYAGVGAGEFDGTISTTAGAQPVAVTIASGNLTLTGANTYVGPTTIIGGSGLQIGNGGSTGSLSSTTAISNNGVLTYNLSSPTTTVPNTITGTGQIVQAGSGALVFSGNTSFGGLAVNSGSIQFGTGGATTVTGTGVITDNGAIIMDSASNVTISSAISGTGSVSQIGSGTLTLSTPGSFSGGVTVSNGTVAAAGSSGGLSALGAGNTTVMAGATLIGTNTDAFGFLGANGSPGTLIINGGTVTDPANSKFRITLPNLVFTGGTLTSASGATGDSNGEFSLQGQQTPAFAVTPENVTTNAASTTAVISATTIGIQSPLTFNVAVGTTPSGVDLLVSSILKNYSTMVEPVTVAGPGVTAFTGNNTFTGGLTVGGGTLQVGTAADTAPLTSPLGAATGAVTNNGIITFASSQTVTIGNSISGTGTVAINSGTVLLNGANSYSGDTTLNGGTLGGTGSISGNVVAGSGAHTIHAGPGGGVVGTFTIGGNLTTNTNTTLAFDLGTPDTAATPGGTSDLLAVQGTLALNGGKLAITSQATTGTASLGYYEVLSYASLTGTTHNIVLPAVVNNILYTLDTTQNPGFIDVHRGFIGDANDDGKVDLNDLNIILNNLGTTNSSWGKGNFDGGTTIDLTDLNDVLNNLGTSIASGSAVVAPAATPEPASLGILALGAAALIARRRKA